MTPAIRKAVPEDLPTIQAIARHTIDMNYRVFLGDEKVDGFISGPCDEYLAGKLVDMYVISAQGTIRGFSVIKGDLIELMMMRHEDHRKGWGSQLIAAMEEILFRGRDKIRLESFVLNHKTNQFYLKNGWHNVGQEFDEAAGEEIYLFIKKKG